MTAFYFTTYRVAFYSKTFQDFQIIILVVNFNRQAASDEKNCLKTTKINTQIAYIICTFTRQNCCKITIVRNRIEVLSANRYASHKKKIKNTYGASTLYVQRIFLY